MVPHLELFPFFRGLEANHLALLQSLFEAVKFAAGATVIEQGAAAEFLYLVERGRVAICYKPYDGERIILSHVEAGGLFGWSAVIGKAQYSSSAVVIEELDALRVRGSDLRRLCAEHPAAGAAILDRLADAVSNRWKDAHLQIRAALKNGMQG
jgi:CRP-like cAMP-binding protein